MSKLADFLTELTDHELAAFYHFRYTEFMKGSKEKIDQEMDQRGIKREEIHLYLKKKPEVEKIQQHYNLCPRCMSSKFYTSKEVETITSSYATVELKVDYHTCLVCHYSQDKIDNQNSTFGYVGPIGFIRKLINRKH